MKIVLCTGGYDPVHSGHLAYFKSARALGDRLIVGLNSDAWLTRKKGRPFMPLHERLALVGNLNMVDEVVVYNDDDGSSSDAIRVVRARHPDADIVFANGGDRTAVNIPEMDIVDNNLEFAFGVGGEDKQNSSSWILQEWKAPKTPRQWGYYRVLHEVAGMKVKELTVNPGCSLSMQRHQHRAEYWIVSEGQCVVNSIMPTGYALPPAHLVPHQEFRIPKTEWHQLTNPFDAPCKIVEIQYGEQCEEEDIERQ
jgi:cytidyltransferase-like protein